VALRSERPGAAVDVGILGDFCSPAEASLQAGFDRSRHPMLIADDRRRMVNGNAAACELLATSHTDLPWCTLDEFTAPSERPRLQDQWAPFLTSGAAEGWYELLVPGRGEIVLEFSALARVLPARHLLVFIEPDQHDAQDAGARKVAWAPVEADGRGAAQLSKRERQVMALIAHGGQSADMAASLILSPETVKTHVHHAMTKLGAHTRAHAVAIAIVTGQISWPIDDSSAGQPPDLLRAR
jgi:DNA-binding CsgD family transcriptional regulator